MKRGSDRALGAVLFTDIVGSTAIASEMGNARWAELVAQHHRIVRREIGRFGGREIDTAGDGFFATFDRPAEAISCAAAAIDAVRNLGIDIRAAVGFGELQGVARKPGGLVVNTTARIIGLAGAAEILVPVAVRDILSGTRIAFEPRGVHELKGIEHEAVVFRVAAVDDWAPPPPLSPDEAAARRGEIAPTPASRRALIVGGVVASLAVAAVFVLLAEDPQPAERPQASPSGNRVVSLDPETGKTQTTVALGLTEGSRRGSSPKHPLASGEGGVWVLRPPALVHVDPLRPKERSDEVDVGKGAFDIQTGQDAVWVLTNSTLVKVNPATNEAEVSLPLHATGSNLAVTSDLIWVGLNDGTLIRHDPDSGRGHHFAVGMVVDWLTVTPDALWIADVLAGDVVRFDPASMRRTGDRVHVTGTIDRIVADGNVVWILDRSLGSVTRFDATLDTKDEARVGPDATDMTVGFGAVWVSDENGYVFRIDATTLAVEWFRVSGEVRGVAVDELTELVWVYAT